MSADPKSKPLRVAIERGQLVISIGVDTLAFAFEHSNSGAGSKVTNPLKFAEDVLAELLREEENGATLVHDLLDEACVTTCQQGSEWIADRDDDE